MRNIMIDISKLTLKEKIISLKSVLLPMFVLSMKRADILSEAMEVRLFNYNKPRSVFKSRKVSLKEKILIIVFTIEFIIVIVGKVLL